MNLITDRTKADVLLRTQKGCYGPADFNRVEQTVAELYAAIGALDVPVKTDWGFPGVFSAAHWPTAAQMQRYLANVSNLCRKAEIDADLPASMENLTWQGANQIEKALEMVYDRIQAIVQAFQYSGEMFAGEENDL